MPDSPNQTRETQHGSIERNPDAPNQPEGEAFDTDDSSEVAIGDESNPDRSRS
ncbi:MAG: hypothetical protein K2Y23_10620 [Cyanobacteria bacterium]|nr:hypothetical protein [Cyanobacteriota bacterium]